MTDSFLISELITLYLICDYALEYGLLVNHYFFSQTSLNLKKCLVRKKTDTLSDIMQIDLKDPPSSI